MKVLHVMESAATGVLTMVAALANEQSAAHSVSVIYSRRPETPKDLSSHFAPAVSLFHLQMSRPIEQIFAVSRLRRAVSEVKPNVVFLHSSIAGFLGRVALLAFGPEVKVFYIPHCISFMRRDVGPVSRLAFRLLERAACARSAVYVACSESERQEIRLALPSTECVLVENAVKIDVQFALARRSRGAPGGRGVRTVVTVGQIRPQKGPARFSELVQRFMREDRHVRFVWIGDGDQRFKADLEQAGVVISGWRAKIEVLEMLCDADAFLSTSLWEGLPIAALESMYCGVPMVLSGCQGNRDVVRHGVSGYIYGSLDEAEEYLRRVLYDSDLAERLTREAFRDFQERFTFERYFSSVEVLLNGCA